MNSHYGMLKLLGTLSMGVSFFFIAWISVTDGVGLFAKAHSRYAAALEKRMRAVFVFSDPNQVILMQAVGMFLAFAIGAITTISWWWLPPILVAIGPLAYFEQLREKRKKKLEEQLDGFLLALGNSLKTTPSIGAAFASCIEITSSPMREEIELATKEMKVGSTLDQALVHIATRIQSPAVDSAFSAILIGRQVGGNLPRLLETTASSMREMRRLDGVIRSKTAEGKMQLYLVGAMPLVLVLGIDRIMPGFLLPLTNSALGYMISIACISAWLGAIVWARNILSVQV